MDILWNTKSFSYLEIEKKLNDEEAAKKRKVKWFVKM